MNLQSKFIRQQDDRKIKHHNYHFHHYNKSILLAVLALFTFWWWYHSIWLYGFVHIGNDAKRLNPLPNHRSRQKHSLIRWETNESAISANKKFTNSVNARKFGFHNKHQLCEKLMYRNER